MTKQDIITDAYTANNDTDIARLKELLSVARSSEQAQELRRQIVALFEKR